MKNTLIDKIKELGFTEMDRDSFREYLYQFNGETPEIIEYHDGKVWHFFVIEVKK